MVRHAEDHEGGEQMVHLMEACLLTALQAYLLGSLLFGVLVSKLFTTMMSACMAAATPA